jgi:Fur family ferric uptake transcriptional regulator
MFRMTLQRQVILDELRRVCGHPTADQLYDRVRQRLPRISLGTVYRNLEILAGQGVIQRLELAGGQRRFDACAERHFHVRCSVCGSVGDILLDPRGLLNEMLPDSSEFQITDIHVEFMGLCPECKDRPTAVAPTAERHSTKLRRKHS